MAYGKRKFNKSQAVANLPAGKTGNVAVKRVYRKTKAVPKRKTDVNKKAIMTLARQVKNLQNQRYGEVQTGIQILQLGNQSQFPEENFPICFALNDFYNATPVYKGTLSQGVPGYSQVSSFNRLSYQSDMNDQFEWCARMNSDDVSSIEYKPISTRLDFSVLFNNMNTPDMDVQMRITLFRVKPVTLEGSVDCSLPSRLGAYRGLCAPYGSVVANYFTPRLHEVIYDKKVRLKNDNDTVKREVHFSIPYTFKTKHVIRPDFTTLPAGQVFITAVPQNEIIWCMISCNTQAFNKFNANGINIRRMLKWRDKHGIAG